MSVGTRLGPSVVTIFGAGGDLCKRKLIPALYNLFKDGGAPASASSTTCRHIRPLVASPCTNKAAGAPASPNSV